MTDKDITESLKCCVKRDCYNCGRLGNDIRKELECRINLMRRSLGLIARQQADIERLEEQIVEVSKTIKSEAIKKFAERLKEKAITYYAIRGRWVSVKDIDELLKEMVGKV